MRQKSTLTFEQGTHKDLSVPWDQLIPYLLCIPMRMHFVGEVAPETIGTWTFLPKRITRLCFIRILIHIAPQFFNSMRELTFHSVGTKAPLSEVSAKRALHFIFGQIFGAAHQSVVLQAHMIITFCWGFRNGIINLDSIFIF